MFYNADREVACGFTDCVPVSVTGFGNRIGRPGFHLSRMSKPWAVPHVIHSDFQRVYNSSFAAISTGSYFLAHGGVVKVAWAYPLAQSPMLLRTVSVSMHLYNITEWSGIGMWINQTALLMSRFGDVMGSQLGELAGRLLSTEFAVYSLFTAAVVGSMIPHLVGLFRVIGILWMAHR